ncbi:MAG: TadE/TadG family type IV pilus assembly protein [Nitrospinota bacterium]
MRRTKRFERSSWRRLLRAASRGRRGQAMVEFALILPILILLIMGVLDFARAFNVVQVVTNAAREGARSGIIPTNTSATVTATVNTYLASAGQTGCTTTGANLGSAGAAGDSVTVTVTCPFQALTGTLIPGWTGTINLSQTATMRHE